jgi:TolB protein
MRLPPLRAYICALGALLVSATTLSAAPAPAAPAGRILFASTRTADGTSDIFSADLGGESIINLTNDSAPDIAPAWSPDGTQVVFASRRSQNWDLFLMHADGRDIRRLTDDPSYDSDPTFSPDGARVAFTSSRAGNLDIYVLDLASGVVEQLTNAPAADYGPAWAPDGRTIAFTSWRDGQQEIYALDLQAGEGGIPAARNVSDNPAPDYDAAWAPDGRRIAFVSDRNSIGALLVLDLTSGMVQNAGPEGRTLSDPAWTPSGALLAAGAWVAGAQRFSNRQGVLIATPGQQGVTYLVGGPQSYSDPSWSPRATTPDLPTPRSSPGRELTIAAVAPAERVPGLASLGDVRAGGRPLLANDVYPSFLALRRAVIEESGHDFLARLSEATRPVDFNSSSASYTSWHKAGRAFDTLFDYSAGGRQVLYIAPDPVAGRLFWRLYLRAAKQDGSQGSPITMPVFNPSSRTLLPPPGGYFVDFTDLAARHGWRRIAAQERDDFNWRSALLALEYWHFERRDGLSWYDAMALVYEQPTLERLFSIEALARAGRRGSFSNLGLPWAPILPPITGPIVRLRGPR